MKTWQAVPVMMMVAVAPLWAAPIEIIRRWPIEQVPPLTLTWWMVVGAPMGRSDGPVLGVAAWTWAGMRPPRLRWGR